MRIKNCITLSSLMGVLLAACAEKPTPVASSPVVGNDKPAAELPSEEACLALAKRIEKSMSAGDTSVFDEAFDIDAMLDRALVGLDLSTELRSVIRSSVLPSAILSPDTGRAISEDGSYKLLRIHTVNGERRALFRMLIGNGRSYHDLTLARGNDGVTKIVDIFPSPVGEDFSTTFRRGLLPDLIDVEKSLLGKLRGPESSYVAIRSNIQEMQALAQQGKHKEALAKCLALPAPVQKDRYLLAQRVDYASKVGVAAYDAAVADYTRWHPDNQALKHLLIDYHFRKKEYDEALACVNALDESVGGDPYLDFMRANLHYAAGRPAEAKAAALRVIESGTTHADPYWILVTQALKAKEFAEVARLMLILEERCGQNIAPGKLQKSELYAEFVKSPEYAKWRAARMGEAPQE